MTSRMSAMSRRAIPVPGCKSRLAGASSLVVACGVAFLVQLGVPAPAAAQWGKLEKLSGPGPFHGLVTEFRVACFGPSLPGFTEADNLFQQALAAGNTVRLLTLDENSNRWQEVADGWGKAGRAWAQFIDAPYEDPSVGSLRQRAFDAESITRDLRQRGYSKSTAISAVGVFWSFCSPTKNRRVGLDVGMHVLRNGGQVEYADGAPIELTTLMSSVSWRLFANSNADFVEVSTGGGVYWFTSRGFPSKTGVVLEPVRLTIRAPSSWSAAPPLHIKRLAAVPSFGIGWTMFPAGFEPDDFNATGEKAVRLTREFIPTIYVLVNVQPLLQFFRP